ncbi:IS1182 family transposase [Catenulispora sp. GAS73]|uniref:IS1182 family transposase n=1 Tax=Catenulispora sp. GAS73 TaxID=3156269 RepID=UPI003517E81B
MPVATAELAWKVHPKGTDEMRVRDTLGPLFADEDFTAGRFAGMFPERGQPGLSPALLAMVTVLQFLHHLSDREAVAAVADRISWTYALGLELDASGFDASVLSEFRDRLAEPGRADALLEAVLDRLKAAGLIRAGQAARTDSTHVLAAVRVLNRVEHVGEALRAALEEIAGIWPEWIVPLLDPGWDLRYGRKVETGRLIGRGRGKTTAEKLAEQIGADGAALLARIDADRSAGWMNALPQVAYLRLLWAQQYRPGPNGGMRLAEPADLPPSARRSQSPYDPQARFSSKNDGEITWTGSKAHLTETCDDDLPHLVIDVHTQAATDPDATATAVIGDRLTHRGLTPGTHLIDSAYPSAAALAGAAARGTTVITPLPRTGRNARVATFGPADFTIDHAAGTATCPAGAVSISSTWEKRGLIMFNFSRKDCTPCLLRHQCMNSQVPNARRVRVHPEPLYQARTAAITAAHADDWHIRYRKRAGIEGTISQAVRGPDLRHARYRGLAKTHVQNTACAIAINIQRLGNHYTTRRPAPRPPTRIHHLCQTHGITTKP